MIIPAVGLVLGSVGLLRPGPTVAALLAVAGGFALALRRDAAEPASRRPHRSSALTLVCLVLAGAAVALSLRLGFDASRSLHFESQHYHLAAVSHFREASTIWTLPFQNPPVFTAAHPALAEVASTIVSFTTDSDRLIYGWIHAASAVLAMLGAALLVRELGGRPAVGALSAVAVLLCPLGIISAHSIANDLIPVAGLVTAGALVLRARAAEAHRWTLACAGVALGLALGTKYTAFAGAALVVIMALVVGHRRRALWLLPGAVALGLPWLVRNWLSFGNPLYPQRVRVAGAEVFAGGSGPLDPYSGTVLAHLTAWRTDALDLWMDLILQVCWPMALAALAGALLVLPLARRRDHRGAAAAAIFGIGLVLAYLATPYTGGGIPPVVDVMGSNLRYVLPALLVGSALLAAVLPKPLDVIVALELVAWSMWKLFDRPMRPDLELTSSIVVATLLVTVAGAIAWAATIALRSSGSGGRSAARTALVWSAPAALLVWAIAADQQGSDDPIPPLEASVSRVVARVGGAEPAEVAVVGVTDLRSVTGPEFERRIEQVTDVREPAPFSAADLDRDLGSVDAPVLVVGRDVGIPSPYVPPADAWCPAEVSVAYAVYVRQDLAVACPADRGGGG